MEFKEIAQLVSGGGAVALCMIVWLELRAHRTELAATREMHRTEMVAMREAIAGIAVILAKQDQTREIKDFIKEEISGVHEGPSAADLDDTPVVTPGGQYRQHKKRAQSKPSAARVVGRVLGRGDRDDENDDDEGGGGR